MSDSPHPFSEELLLHRHMMLGLARDLVGSAEAEDVVQDAWVQALRRPPTTEENLGGWLMRITRNLAFNRGRARVRRRVHESSAARPELVEEAKGQLDERFELSLQVAESVRALSEPYRTVVLMRYFENRSHEEIARALDRPLATVRTQLRRGLEQLRTRMDRECGGRASWTAGLVAWLESQRSVPYAPPASASWPIPTLVAGATLALGAGAVWYWLAAPRRESLRSTAPSLAAPVASREERPIAPQRESAGSRATLQSTDEGGASWWLEGRVLGPSAGPTRVQVEPVWRAYSVAVEPLRAEADADGRFAMDLTPLVVAPGVLVPAPDAFDLLLDHRAGVPVRVRLWREDATLDEQGRHRFTVERTLIPAAVLEGVVLGPDGRPLGDAFVLPFSAHDRAPSAPTAELVRTDSEGRYRLRVEEEGEYLVAIAAEGLRPATLAAHPFVGRELPLVPTRLELGESLAGFALRQSVPLEGAAVELHVSEGRALNLGFPGNPPELAWLGERFEWARVTVQSDDTGAFRCSGLAPAVYGASLRGLSGVDVTLPRTAPAATFVRAPAEGVELSLAECLLEIELRGVLAESGQLEIRGAHGVLAAPVRVPGRFRILAPAAAELSLAAVLPGGGDGRLDLWTPEAGGWSEHVLDCFEVDAEAALELHVRTSPPREEVRLWLALQSEGLESEQARFTRFVDVRGGVALLEGLPAGPHRLVLREGQEPLGTSFYPSVARVLTLRPGEAYALDVELALAGQLRVDVQWRGGERRPISFRLIDAQGRVVDARFEAFVAGERTSSHTRLIPWAENRLVEPLPPGIYELAAWSEGQPEQRVSVRIVAGSDARAEFIF